MLDKINGVVANLGTDAGRKTVKAEDSVGGEGPEARELGRNKLWTPGGPRKCLKRLDPDKEIKVNSRDFPRKSKTIPKEFPRNSKENLKPPLARRQLYNFQPRNGSRRPLLRRRL